jgi:glycosyltransferase involved in cell wall biosynthesis
VGHAIESALGQSWADKEVIVFDDGSTDGSLQVIKDFGNRIQWLSDEQRGANAARNSLLEVATGEWLQYLDADDYLLPDKIAKQLATLREVPHADVLFGQVTIEYPADYGVAHERAVEPETLDPWILVAGWSLSQTGSCLFRKQALLSINGWNSEQPCCQDYELYLRLLIAGKRFEYTATDGAIYRRFNSGSLSTRNVTEVYRQRLLIVDRLEEHLVEKRDLTPERIRAINDARFETARLIDPYDADLASRAIQRIRSSEPEFSPRGRAAPPSYRLAYQLLGFSNAQRLAGWRRRVYEFLGGYRSLPGIRT